MYNSLKLTVTCLRMCVVGISTSRTKGLIVNENVLINYLLFKITLNNLDSLKKTCMKNEKQYKK